MSESVNMRQKVARTRSSDKHLQYPFESKPSAATNAYLTQRWCVCERTEIASEQKWPHAYTSEWLSKTEMFATIDWLSNASASSRVLCLEIFPTWKIALHHGGRSQ